MDMDEAMDEAVRAKALLRELLAEEIEDGKIHLMTPGSTGELHGDHRPTVGVHLTINGPSFRNVRSNFLDKVKSVKDRGVDIIFFPVQSRE